MKSFFTLPFLYHNLKTSQTNPAYTLSSISLSIITHRPPDTDRSQPSLAVILSPYVTPPPPPPVSLPIALSHFRHFLTQGNKLPGMHYAQRQTARSRFQYHSSTTNGLPSEEVIQSTCVLRPASKEVTSVGNPVVFSIHARPCNNVDINVLAICKPNAPRSCLLCISLFCCILF